MPHFVAAHPAVRCGECHGAMHEQWKSSAHARSISTPLYAAMRREEAGGGCDGCHAPMRSMVDPQDLVAREGVTCEVCHAIKDVEVRKPAPKMTLEPGVIKRGPRCDARDHYFHKMGCSPLHREGRICAGCHQWSRPGPGGSEVPIFTEYEEWQNSPSGTAGISCQDCHMPGAVTEIAPGSATRAGVPNHGFMGEEGDLVRRALELAVASERRGGEVRVRTTLRNHGAGHSMPAGLPGRQLVLRVSTLDAGGKKLASREIVYSRVLLDAKGQEAPFYRAVALGSDSRIAAGKTRIEEMSFAGAGVSSARVELVSLAFSPLLVASLGVAPPEELLLDSVTVGIGQKGRGADLAAPRPGSSKP